MTILTAALVWDPVLPLPAIVLLWLALAALAIWSTARGGPRLKWTRRTALISLRLAALTLLMLPLLQPSREESIPRQFPERLALVAVDTSRSMAEKDAESLTRLDAARQLLRKHKLNGRSPLGTTRLFSFDSDSRPLALEALDALTPNGETTLFNTSIGNVMHTLTGKEQAVGLFLFTDGHDFEGQPPERLGRIARQYKLPIYPIPLGRTINLPDVALSMVSAQPSTFIRQKTRLEAAARFRSSPARSVRVELLRGGEVIRNQKITSTGDDEVTVGFDVSEDTPGQFEYEIRCATQPDERDVDNNTAFTYLNVTDARIPILLIEGEPHWDSSFLLRTLSRNDRMSMDSAVLTSKTKLQTSRSENGLPRIDRITPGLLDGYPVIILGRSVEKILTAECLATLTKSVNEGGLTLIFARGRPGPSPIWEELSPAPLGDGFTGPVSIATTGMRGSVVPMELLTATGPDKLPPLPAATTLGKPKPLASVEATASDDSQKNTLPAMVMRQQGTGQVFAVALDGMWKWALHAGAQADNNIYDRFWNQLLLNLIARSNRTPADKPQLTVPKANLQTGEQIHFTLRLPSPHNNQPLEFPAAPQIRLSRDGAETAILPMLRTGDTSPWSADLTANEPGRFRAEVTLPDGSKVACRFGVYQPVKETSDVATDVDYLRKLAAASGGRVLDAASLGGLLETLTRAAAAQNAAPPIIRRHTLWDQAPFFWLLCSVFGTDWFLRRRWGLV